MKKARIFLAAIAVFGIVGGSLAFKAKSAFGGKSIFYSTTATTDATQLFSSEATVSLLGTTNFYYWTTVDGGNASVQTHLTTVSE